MAHPDSPCMMYRDYRYMVQAEENKYVQGERTGIKATKEEEYVFFLQKCNFFRLQPLISEII
jgi:hypothetical protein